MERVRNIWGVVAGPWVRRLRRPGWPYWLALGLVSAAAVEMRTSWLQSRMLAATGRRLTFQVEKGPSSRIRFPGAGPYDHQMGFTRMPSFFERLMGSGFVITAQARSSPFFHRLTGLGLYAPYHEKAQAGLAVVDRVGTTLYEARYPRQVYKSFQAIPPVIVETLAFIENREILDDPGPYRNPSIEWDRFTKAVIDLGLNRIHDGHPVSGGSTLATQLEKIRHSPGGRTSEPAEKAVQMASASVRAYLDGENTTEARRRIVTEYLNSMPLASTAGFGEVHGLGDGLWAWFGADFETVNQRLRVKGEDEETALAYRQALSLLLALRRPTFYLRQDRDALNRRVEAYLRMLAGEGVIAEGLRDGALKAKAEVLSRAPEAAPRQFAGLKATDGIRAQLESALGVGSLYELDRLDLTVHTTLDAAANSGVSLALSNFAEPELARSAGLTGGRLLSTGDPGEVVYSVTLYERTEAGNLLRIQADNYNQPLNVNQGTRLELGSTAKLRTLVHYLEMVAELHREGVARQEHRKDQITMWAANYLSRRPEATLKEMLEEAMGRTYSANPAERFFTGGGLHTFSNFDGKDDGRVMTVREAFERSVNLVFIRLMRDIVWYHAMRVPGVTAATLTEDKDAARLRLLRQFADQEGSVFLTRFYRQLEAGERIGSHPLALWLEEYMKVRPKATLKEVLAAGAEERQLAYDWLFRSRHKAARDKRVWISLEAAAFQRVHEAWKRAGYPFENLTPSYATAIGSSGDNPAALAELAGIILNEGVRRPTLRVEKLHFAARTPYETVVERKPADEERVLEAEVARAIRREMIGVVEHGTGRRANGVVVLKDGRKLEVAGKTGTGDNRFETYSKGGAVLNSRAVNRTAAFVFQVGDGYFGVVTAFVDGRKAERYQFTSALPVQVFKHLAEVFGRLAEGG